MIRRIVQLMLLWPYQVDIHISCCVIIYFSSERNKKVPVGKDQEKAQSEMIPTPKTEVGKNKLTIRYLYHETYMYRKPNEQLFFQ